MINHVLLELFCLKSRDDKTKECNLDCPAYECLVKKCPYCSFTSHENALCYVDNLANASHIISLGGEMLPNNINKQKVQKINNYLTQSINKQVTEKDIYEVKELLNKEILDRGLPF